MIIRSVAELASHRETFVQRVSRLPASLEGLCGFDGFIDTFVRLKQPATMADFGPRVTAASGIAASFPVGHGGDHFGGNGPLLATGLDALFGERVKIHYIGAVGATEVHSLFKAGFQGKLASLHPIAAPAHSTCLEFEDGKIMLSDMASCAEVTWERLLERIGEETLDQILRNVEFIGAVNWGKLPHAGDIWVNLATRLDTLGRARKEVPIFMDLAEFEHRPSTEVERFLAELPQITKICQTTLSLNLKEAWQLAQILGHDFVGQRTTEEVVAMTEQLHAQIDVDRVIVHPNDGAAASSERGTSFVPGPLCRKPFRSTGAGDHFGAACLAATALGVDDSSVLLAGVLASGYFVRTGQSPSWADVVDTLDQWISGTLPD